MEVAWESRLQGLRVLRAEEKRERLHLALTGRRNVGGELGLPRGDFKPKV